MIALVTGASSGIGRDIAKALSEKGYDLIVVARRSERLLELRNELKVNVRIIVSDLSVPENCFKLYKQAGKIDILVNNAGFGLFGEFDTTDITKELKMIDLNIKAVHILTKLFLKDFIKEDKGYILNVASSAAFFSGPLMSEYYASKAYVMRLTQGIYEELRQKKSSVYIGALCPGPVHTEFGKNANVNFSVKGLNSRDVANYAIKKMFKRKLIIVPGAVMKTAHVLGRLLPDKILLKICYHIQNKKT